MGKAATRAKNKYNTANYDRISLVVPKGNKDIYKNHALSKGFKSLNDMIIKLIDADIAKGQE